MALTDGGVEWCIAQISRSVHVSAALDQSGHLVSSASRDGYMQWPIARVTGTVHIVGREFEKLTEMLVLVPPQDIGRS